MVGNKISKYSLKIRTVVPFVTVIDLTHPPTTADQRGKICSYVALVCSDEGSLRAWCSRDSRTGLWETSFRAHFSWCFPARVFLAQGWCLPNALIPSFGTLAGAVQPRAPKGCQHLLERGVEQKMCCILHWRGTLTQLTSVCPLCGWKYRPRSALSDGVWLCIHTESHRNGSCLRV